MVRAGRLDSELMGDVVGDVGGGGGGGGVSYQFVRNVSSFDG